MTAILVVLKVAKLMLGKYKVLHNMSSSHLSFPHTVRDADSAHLFKHTNKQITRCIHSLLCTKPLITVGWHVSSDVDSFN